MAAVEIVLKKFQHFHCTLLCMRERALFYRRFGLKSLSMPVTVKPCHPILVFHRCTRQLLWHVGSILCWVEGFAGWCQGACQSGGGMWCHRPQQNVLKAPSPVYSGIVYQSNWVEKTLCSSEQKPPMKRWAHNQCTLFHQLFTSLQEVGYQGLSEREIMTCWDSHMHMCKTLDTWLSDQSGFKISLVFKKVHKNTSISQRCFTDLGYRVQFGPHALQSMEITSIQWSEFPKQENQICMYEPDVDVKTNPWPSLQVHRKCRAAKTDTNTPKQYSKSLITTHRCVWLKAHN